MEVDDNIVTDIGDGSGRKEARRWFPTMVGGMRWRRSRSGDSEKAVVWWFQQSYGGSGVVRVVPTVLWWLKWEYVLD